MGPVIGRDARPLGGAPAGDEAPDMRAWLQRAIALCPCAAILAQTPSGCRWLLAANGCWAALPAAGRPPPAAAVDPPRAASPEAPAVQPRRGARVGNGRPPLAPKPVPKPVAPVRRAGAEPELDLEELCVSSDSGSRTDECQESLSAASSEDGRSAGGSSTASAEGADADDAELAWLLSGGRGVVGGSCPPPRWPMTVDMDTAAALVRASIARPPMEVD
ncbi:unnamed protein product [Prorocentrum cordatum]|uniref:Uncharacterized protein n=1 Tax=Prorocentrum cordatum TaxID=2364126 RepID=A0ABN9V6B9_9DINO|nr:unnamed protein product [Polarella glacialis]